MQISAIFSLSLISVIMFVTSHNQDLEWSVYFFSPFIVSCPMTVANALFIVSVSFNFNLDLFHALFCFLIRTYLN